MANHCYLDTSLECPYCRQSFLYSVAFQWGFSYWSYYEEEWAYHIEDPILWKALPDGSIPAWTYFHDAVRRGVTANLGDPVYRDLIVLNNYFHGAGGNPYDPWLCPCCGHVLWSTAVEIKDNVLVRAWIIERDDFDNLAEECDYYLVEESGRSLPMLGWQYKPMPTLEILDVEKIRHSLVAPC